jgi:hypothetical protein
MIEPLTRDSAGFRLRGLSTTRIEAFTDAAFAFALTLLVISFQPPESFADLRAATDRRPDPEPAPDCAQRSTVIGSTRVARRTGTSSAAVAQASRVRTAAPSTRGSNGGTP